MAIQFARIEIVSRKSGGNACCKGAYNARTKILDERTNTSYNFSNRGDNVYHEVLLPEHVDKSFANTEILMNAVEKAEKKHNSQLLKDVVIALPDDKELNLQDRINITHKIIEEMEWVKNGLAVQMDIHQPHDGEINWHAHLLVTTRRFTEDGKSLFHLKARDLNPEFKTGKNGNYIVPEEEIIHEKGKRIINDYFKALGLENRVDSIGIIAQEHVGPVRMRNVLNQAMERNEQRKLVEVDLLNTGKQVLDKVTRHVGVFSKGDLVRAVKIIDDSAKQGRLIQQALADKSVVELFKENGETTGYFTTEEIRQEEKKICRLADYVVTGSNNNFIRNKNVARLTSNLIENARAKLTDEQHKALEELLTTDKGLHVLPGRAGVGKSHVLRQVSEIAKAANIHAIGLAPTHKAKEVLSDAGFEQTATVKGMLFKLHNARFLLPKNSLLVIDEAGMIGNDDYQELLRVAATRKCQVILSGDENQLASVQRGGMFEVFADKYGSSTILDIKRQASSWGRQVSMAFSKGEVKTGVEILQQENRISWHNNLDESMYGLLADWNKSAYLVEDRFILAVKNKDVAALNHGVREYLKINGVLTGAEVKVAGNHYMKGDRIMITSSNKELGLVNGELGVLQETSKDKFTILINNQDKAKSRTVEFNPSKYNGFKHGYATTVFKAQGSSIKDVYVCHNGFAGIRNSYVALSRNINELKLYANNSATANERSLIKQLSYDPEIGSSLHLFTKEEIKLNESSKETLKNIGMLDKMLFGAYNFVERNLTKLADKYLPESEYYNYREPSSNQVNVSDVLDQIYEKYTEANSNIERKEEKLVVGSDISISNNHQGLNPTISNDNKNSEMIATIDSIEARTDSGISNNFNSEPQASSISTNFNNNSTIFKAKSSAKDRFYARADYVRNQEQRVQENREHYRNEVDSLRNELSIKAESIVFDLLGKPNKKLSTRSMYKYGNNGSLAVKIGGRKAGVWYDFSKGEGGDLFDLVQQEKNLDFKESVDYLKDKLGIRKHNLQLVENHKISDKYADYHKNRAKEQAIEAAKIKKAENLYSRSKAIEQRSTASCYLTKIRKIDIAFDKAGNNNDIRTAYIYDKSLGKKAPALLAFARDKDGLITGGNRYC